MLELGCGTCVIIKDTFDQTNSSIYGIDIDKNLLTIGNAFSPKANLVQADAYSIPFPNNYFDTTFFHFFLLWITAPEKILFEAKRVTLPKGNIIAFAEPDYGYRIDYPPALNHLGKFQTKSLFAQGADPFVGRRLTEIFSDAGISIQECGILGGRWRASNPFDADLEWKILEMDVEQLIPKSELSQLRKIDKKAWKSGQRILFVPTFYAWGKVNK